MMRKFKYHINHFASIQPQHITIDDLAKNLKGRHNIPSHIFDKDRRLQSGDPYEIPENRLKIYAQLLEVPVNALVEESTESYA